MEENRPTLAQYFVEQALFVKNCKDEFKKRNN